MPEIVSEPAPQESLPQKESISQEHAPATEVSRPRTAAEAEKVCGKKRARNDDDSAPTADSSGARQKQPEKGKEATERRKKKAKGLLGPVRS